MKCFWCNRDLTDEDIGRRVTVGFSTRWMCDHCWDQNSPETPLDYEQPEFDRESQPEFNGAFDRW